MFCLFVLIIQYVLENNFLYSNSRNGATPFFAIITQRDHKYATHPPAKQFYVFLATVPTDVLTAEIRKTNTVYCLCLRLVLPVKDHRHILPVICYLQRQTGCLGVLMTYSYIGRMPVTLLYLPSFFAPSVVIVMLMVVIDDVDENTPCCICPGS